MHVENDTVDVYIGKKVREPRWKEIVSFDVFFLFFFLSGTNRAITKKKQPALAFFHA